MNRLHDKLFKKDPYAGTIFESATFINEGVGGAILAMLSIPFIATGLLVASLKFNSKAKRNEYRKMLANELNTNKELSVLKSKLKKGTRVISVESLSKRVKISDKDKKIIDNYDISVLAMVDTKDNIIAYCLINPINTKKIEYGYTIVDKGIGTSKDVNMFIAATFEFKIGLGGEGIKYFAKKPANSFDFTFNGSKDIHDNIKNKANYLSEKESKDVIKRMNTFMNDLVKKLNSVGGQFSVYDYDTYNNGNAHYITIMHDGLAKKIDELESDDYYMDDFWDDMGDDYDKQLEILRSKVQNILKPMGFEMGDKGCFISNSNEYKYISVSIETVVDDSPCYFDIIVRSTKQLAK